MAIKTEDNAPVTPEIRAEHCHRPARPWIVRKLFSPATDREIEDDAQRSMIPSRPIVALVTASVSAAAVVAASLGVIRFLMLRSR